MTTRKMGNSGRSGKRPTPQPGDKDYKTATQLRNARKRRKTKQSKQELRQKTTPDDPSSMYLDKPMNAPIVKQAMAFFQEKQQKFGVFVGPITGWRTVAKLAVRLSSGCLRIGLFVPGSHELLEVPQCKAHHPRINSAVQVLQKLCRKNGIDPFDEKSGKGSLRHVAISIERATGKQQITLVWNEDEAIEDQSSKLKNLCNALVRQSENGDERLSMHSLWVHYNNSWKHANSIFDRDGKWEKRYGESGNVVEALAVDKQVTVPLQFPPQVFRQANIDAFTGIVSKIRSWLKAHPARRCLELYGGVGTIGLHLIDLFNSFVSSDENPFNKDCFEVAASQVKVKKPGKKCKEISYEPKNAADMVQSGALRQADVVIVDPPRKGLDEEVVGSLCEDKTAQTLIYVSCGFDAFTRDFKSLTESGQWVLDHAEGHVLFPGSDAIETLAFFTRH